MATAAQLAANLANAQHSTGPQSDAGKARSARNATTHGLFSQEFALTDGERARFDALHASFLDTFQPQTIVEASFVRMLSVQQLRLQRLIHLEDALWAEHQQVESATAALELLTPHLDRLHRYETRLTRNYNQVRKELAALQARREADGLTESGQVRWVEPEQNEPNSPPAAAEQNEPDPPPAAPEQNEPNPAPPSPEAIKVVKQGIKFVARVEGSELTAWSYSPNGARNRLQQLLAQQPAA